MSITIAEIAEKVRIPVSGWGDASLSVMSRCGKEILSTGYDIVCGAFAGKFHADSEWRGNKWAPHVWILTRKKIVVDLTRWVFECRDPYCFVEHADADYDPYFCRTITTYCPKFRVSNYPLSFRHLSAKSRNVLSILVEDIAQFGLVSKRQRRWLRTLAPSVFGSAEREICDFLARR